LKLPAGTPRFLLEAGNAGGRQEPTATRRIQTASSTSELNLAPAPAVSAGAFPEE
jgi:hypothetical protein